MSASGWLRDCEIIVQKAGECVTEGVFICRGLSFLWERLI